MTQPSDARQVQFAHPWTNPDTGITYTTGQLATLALDLAKKVVYNALARFTDETVPPGLVPPGPVDDVELRGALNQFEKKVPRAGANPGYVVTLDSDSQSLRLAPAPAGGGGSGGSSAGGATSASQGLIRLRGDLGGDADNPTVPGLGQRLTLEQVQDAVAAMIVGGTNIAVAYDDNLGTLTITSLAAGGTGGGTDPEVVRDTIGTALVAGQGVQIAVSDDANTITISAPGAVTGTDPETVRDVMAAALRGGPNVNITVDDAGDTITIGAPGVAGLSVEDVQDIVAAFIVPGNNMNKSYDDAANVLTLSATTGGGAGSTDPEVVRDTIAASLMGTSKIQVTSDDTNNTITIATSATVNQPDSFLLNRTNHIGVAAVPDWSPGTTYLAGSLVLRAGVLQVARTFLDPAPTFDQSKWFAQGTPGGVIINVPSKVTGIMVGTRTASTLPLSWTAATDATSYLVEYRVTGSATWSTAGTALGTSFSVTSLTGSTNYDVRVTARNSAGPGVPSDVLSTSTTTQVETAPDLTISNVRWNTATPRVGEPVTFSADVTNLGGTLPGGTIIGVSFKVNGASVSWSDSYSGAIANGQTVALTANGGPSGVASWTPGSAGAFTVTASVDDANRVPNEGNETNNSTSSTISVSATTSASGLPFTGTWGADSSVWPAPWVSMPTQTPNTVVVGGKGLLKTPTAYGSTAARHGSLSVKDVELAGTVAVSPAGTFSFSAHARATDWTSPTPTSSYSLLIYQDNSTNIRASIKKTENSSPADLTGYSVQLVLDNTGTYVGDIKWKFSLVGGTLKAKVWKAADPEPTSYGMTVTEASPLGAGTVGVSLLAGATTVPALQAAVSAFTVTDTAAAVSPPTALSWKSGASLAGNPPPIDDFAAWRNRPVDITGAWIDNNTSQVEVWSLLPIGELANWTKDLDLAVGAIDYGETWAAAATGAYDDRWRQSLTNIKTQWNRIPRTGQLYLRFAHEMNGNWYPWKTTYYDNKADFIAAWRRYRALQQEIFPAAKLVFSVNRDGVNNEQDWRVLWPGDQYVDLCGVDYYNQYPNVNTQAEWDAELSAYDKHGGPRGLEAHRQFALERGKPLVVSEWANNARVEDGFRDAPFWMQKMYDYFKEHAGTGPGQIPYEIHFNPAGAENGKWAIWPDTLQPLSAAAYRAAWGNVAASAPNAPNITLTSQGNVRAVWTAPVSNGAAISGYVLQRRAYSNGTAGPWGTISSPAASATSYVDTAVTVGTTYGYQLAAVNSAGQSAFSAEQTITVAAASAASFAETFPGANGSAWPAEWTVTASRGAAVSGATQVNGTGKLALPGVGGTPSLAARRSINLANFDLTFNVSSSFDTSSPAAAESYRDVFLRMAPGADAASVGNWVGAYVLTLFPSSSNPTGSTWNIQLLRRTGGVETILAVQPRAIAAGVRDFSCHVRLVGNRLQASVWQAGQPEPAAWVMDVTDTAAEAITSVGDIALTGSGSGATNTGLTVSYSNVVLMAAT